jgi:superfamily II DNA helicase RecQ
LTLPFDPATGGFRTEPLDALCRRCEVLRVQPAFFTHQEIAYWTLVVTHRLRAAPEEAAVRRGVERTTLPASAAVPGGAVAGAPATGGDLRGDLRGDPRGKPQTALLSAADAALYQELRVWRAEVADVAGIPVFMILTNRQLHDIVRVRPASLAALGGISGIGQARLQKYGRALLDRVRGGAEPPAEHWSAPMSGPNAAVADTPVLTPKADADGLTVTEEPGSAPTADPSPEIPSHA